MHSPAGGMAQVRAGVGAGVGKALGTGVRGADGIAGIAGIGGIEVWDAVGVPVGAAAVEVVVVVDSAPGVGARGWGRMSLHVPYCKRATESP